MASYQLAQINIAKAQAPMESQHMQGFTSRLDEINALAEASPGFVWRLQTEEGDATAIRAFRDPDMLINISVWEDLQSLRDFVYRSTHVELLQQRDAWFDKTTQAHQALWWVPAGHQPGIEEAKARLESLQANGPSAEVFSFGRAFAPPEA